MKTSSNNRQQITDNKIFLRVFLFLFFVLSSLFFGRQTQAATYPISDLGNCRDKQECRLYCEILVNTPACWSYGKYVINGDVLGETDVNISYPIADLGNCGSAQECFLYCAHPSHQKACIEYAKNTGLVKEEEEEDSEINEAEIVSAAKEELGCEGKVACMALCNIPTNTEKCMAFAKKHGIDKSDHKPGLEVMSEAHEKLGCDSETSCNAFCQKEENREKCYEFAKEHKLLRKSELKKYEEVRENGKQILEAAKTELGCDSKESCYKICSDQTNREKCANLGQKFGMGKNEMRPQSTGNSDGLGGINKSSLDKPTDSSRPGEFLGPSGCKTEGECKSYCQNNPDKCPGFPRIQVTPKPSLYQIQPAEKMERMETRETKPTEYEEREDELKTNPSEYPR